MAHVKVLVLRGFAVPKNAAEDRFIVPLGVNELLDPERLPRPVFAYLPALRSLCVPRGGRLLVSKRDARHYYHSLRLGRRWRPWLALLAPKMCDAIATAFPVMTTSPMRFGSSAGFAQAVTDLATQDLKEQVRLRFGAPMPMVLPIWGSIVDDMWVFEHEDEECDPVDPAWPDGVWQRCAELGAEVNDLKP